MTAIHGLIATGGIIFWVLLLIEAWFLFVCMADSYGAESFDGEKQKDGSGVAATISLVSFFMVLFIFGDWSIFETFSWIRAHWVYAAWGLGGYVAIGTPWSIFYAWFRAKMRGEPYRLAKVEWLRAKGVGSGDSIPDELLDEWANYVNLRENLKRLSQTPMFSSQKGRICRTLAYWPLSMLWFFGADFLGHISQVITQRLRDVYQQVMDSAYRDIREDFRPKPKAEDQQ